MPVVLQVSEHNNFTFKGWRIWVRLSKKHCGIFKGHRLLSATNLIYITFICFHLVNCSGQVPTVSMFCRSMKPQSIEKMNILIKSSGRVQEQLRQAVWGIEKGTWSLSEVQRRPCPWGASAVLSLRTYLSILVTMVLSCLFRKARNAGTISLH